MREPITKQKASELLKNMIAESEEKIPEGGFAERDRKKLEDLLWETLRLYAGEVFYTAKGLAFIYTVRGHEMFVSRKDKSLTRATVLLAFYRALELQKSGEKVKGPKKLGTFGASYIYPVFIRIGVIKM